MSDEEEFVEYEDMTIPELKAEADARDPAVHYKASDNKATIIAALEQWDDEHGETPEETPDDVQMAPTQSEDAPPDEPPPPPDDTPRPTTFAYTLRPKSLSYLNDTSWEMANWKATARAAMDAGLNPVGDPRRVDVNTDTSEVTYEVDVV